MRTISVVAVMLGLLVTGFPAPGGAQAPEGRSDAGFWRWALADVRRGGAGPAVPWVQVRLDGFRLEESARPPRRDGRLGSSDLGAILGEAVLGRLLERAGVEAPRGFLNGRWQEGVASSGARVLQVRVVDRPLAEISDLDGDGRADAVLLYRPGA